MEARIRGFASPALAGFALCRFAHGDKSSFFKARLDLDLT
jgi:hypothetical protein